MLYNFNKRQKYNAPFVALARMSRSRRRQALMSPHKAAERTEDNPKGYIPGTATEPPEDTARSGSKHAKAAKEGL